jgi:DNA-binding PadR family transcriptional regulator
MKHEALTLDLLVWLSEQPRSYDEVMQTWRSTCPRLSIWEDAVSEGLVEVERSDSSGKPYVALTARGKSAIDARTA